MFAQKELPCCYARSTRTHFEELPVNRKYVAFELYAFWALQMQLQMLQMPTDGLPDFIL